MDLFVLKHALINNDVVSVTYYSPGTSVYYVDPKDLSNVNELQGNRINAISLLQINGVSYVWKDSKEKDLGVIAQEIELIYPELVSTNSNGDKTVDYTGLVAPLIESIKELNEKIEEQNRRIEE